MSAKRSAGKIKKIMKTNLPQTGGGDIPKKEGDTLSPPATMLVNFFFVSQLIPKIHAWAVPKMPGFDKKKVHFG